MAKPTLDFSDDNVDEELPPSLDDPTSSGMSDEDFGNLDFDNEEAEKVSMELNPPAATWEKSQRWEVTRTTNGNDMMAGDKDPNGRTYFKIEGYAESKTIEGQVYVPKITINISPDKRADRKDPSKFDYAYNHYIKYWEMFVADNGRKPAKVVEFMNYLRDGNYFVRTYRGNNGPMVNELISKVDMKKRQR